jgi:hypothetical protein
MIEQDKAPDSSRRRFAAQTSTSTWSPRSSISSRRAAASPLPISRAIAAAVPSKPGVAKQD